MDGKALIMDEKAMSRAINRISYEIIERNKGTEELCIIGIFSRGVELAQLVTRRGSCDVDDVILNTLGGLLGYLLFALSRRLARRTAPGQKDGGMPAERE